MVCNQRIHGRLRGGVKALAHTPPEHLNEMQDQLTDILSTLSEGRNDDRKHVKPIVEITAKLTTCNHLGQVAMRNSFGWRASGKSPISSRKRVPVSAISKRPIFCATAPGKAPFSCPNNSLSKRSKGMAAQLSFTNGRPQRALRL